MRTFSLLILLFVGASLTTLAQQPFEQFGVKVKVLSLSNGHYPEFFANDSLRRVGSVVYNRRLHRIACLLPPDSLVSHPKPEVASRWLSTDPHAGQYSQLSPYAFSDNNPINNTDPDGRDIIYKASQGVLDKKTGVTIIRVTVSVTVKALNQSQLNSTEFSSRVADFKSNLKSSLHGEHEIKATKTKYIFSAGTIDVQVASSMKDVKPTDHLMTMVDDVTGLDAKGGPRGGVAALGGRIAYVQSTEGGNNMTHEFGHNMGFIHNWESRMTEDNGDDNYMSYNLNKMSSFSGRQLYNSMTGDLNQGSNSSTLSAPALTTDQTTQKKPYLKGQEGDKVPKPLE